MPMSGQELNFYEQLSYTARISWWIAFSFLAFLTGTASFVQRSRDEKGWQYKIDIPVWLGHIVTSFVGSLIVASACIGFGIGNFWQALCLTLIGGWFSDILYRLFHGPIMELVSYKIRQHIEKGGDRVEVVTPSYIGKDRRKHDDE